MARRGPKERAARPQGARSLESGDPPAVEPLGPSKFVELREHELEPDGARLFIATLRIRVPEGIWTGAFSRAHPFVRIEALNRSEVTPDVSVSDYWISGAAPGEWAAEILTYDEVLKVDSLAEVGQGCLYRITYQNPPVVYLYRRLSLPLQFPLRIQGGYIQWEVVARRTEFDEVLAYAREVDPELSVVSIRRRPLRTHLPMLTEVQQEMLAQAMQAGYFAVPRGITLTDLAAKLHRSKSSVSESIAVIEKKLLESALRTGVLTS